MKILRLIRAAEWWEYKFPPIFIVPYLIVLRSNLSLNSTFNALLFILIALFIGAFYVSILNDLTDIKEDAMAGKKNRLAGQNRLVQAMLLLLPAFCGGILSWMMRSNLMALLFYIFAYVCFTLYSLPPFRFKQRGLAGIITDAAGSQLFPTLFAMAYMASVSGYNLLLEAEIILTGIWAFCFGIRGIFWHQFHDLENDRRSGLLTIVQSMNNLQIKVTGIVIITMEIAALIGLLFLFNNSYLLVSLFIYFAYLLLRKRKKNVQIILLKYTQANYCIFMNEYYQVFLPFALLVLLSFQQSSFIILLFLSSALFPFGLYRIFRNVFL